MRCNDAYTRFWLAVPLVKGENNMRNHSIRFFAVLLGVAVLLAGCNEKSAADTGETARSTAQTAAESTTESTAESTVERTAEFTSEPTAESNAERTAVDTADWVIAPQYDFDEMQPIYSRQTHTIGFAGARGLYAVQQGESWSIFDADTGSILLQDVSQTMPYLYDEQELALFPTEADENDSNVVQRNQNTLTQQLQAGGRALEAILFPNGSYAWLWEYSDGQVEELNLCRYDSYTVPLAQASATNLLPVCSMDADGDIMGYAVCGSEGSLLTDFVYRYAAMPGDSLIAVQDESGSWGYCDTAGALAIPCEYQSIFTVQEFTSGEYEGYVQLPYADLGGTLVVKNINGQKQVLSIDGTQLVEPGQYEDLASAVDGCVWAKQNGLWGLLRAL